MSKYIKKLNGEEYVLCWIERNNQLFNMFIGQSWATHLQFVNLNDVRNPGTRFRTFNIGRAIPNGMWINSVFIDKLWEYTKTGRIENMRSSYMYIVADGRNMDFLIKLINEEAERKNQVRDVLVFRSIDDLIPGASHSGEKPGIEKMRGV